MDKRFIFKMVENCLKQYNQEADFSVESKEFSEIFHKITQFRQEHKKADLHDIVNDVVYGYITDSPYF